ncbi:Protein YIPF1 [Sciurus carolinensis]|uniref:Protein YIPF n=1 Tax=Sciurus carolinensis TaxID=30640 RepID=A0AA41TAD4_SCICA|nr:Protein YIPF1 [Sciurus carolinensis]
MNKIFAQGDVNLKAAAGTRVLPGGEGAQACVTLTNRTGFLCHDQRSCIPASRVCDGLRTCPHGDDEDESLCQDVPQSLPSFLLAHCGDRASWIYSDQKCDGINNCGDCSDELSPGPFWICATLVFAIAISGNLSNFLIHLGEKTYHYVPEFRKVSIAATIIYAYAWLVPLALWGFLMWRNSKVMNIVSYSFLEIVCVYGYSLFIYIPTAILWIIPQKAVRWILVMIALGISGSVLAMTFWPAVREDNRRIALATIVTIVLLHMLLSVGCLAYFFDAPEMDHLPTTTATPNQTVAAAKSS